VSWNHLICEAILFIIVIIGCHAYYHNQWEAHLTTVVSKVIQEVERSSRPHNVLRSNDYHDNHTEQHFIRDSVVSSCSYGNTTVSDLAIMKRIVEQS